MALFFAIHAMRAWAARCTGSLILFSFPLLGSIVYFVVEYLPASRLRAHRGQGRERRPSASSTPSASTARPTQAYDLARTAQNKLRLAKAALDRGQFADAVGHYHDALSRARWPRAIPSCSSACASALIADGASLRRGQEALRALQGLLLDAATTTARTRSRC